MVSSEKELRAELVNRAESGGGGERRRCSILRESREREREVWSERGSRERESNFLFLIF